MKKVKMEEMTWEEIKRAIENGIDTVILIIGSIEQHGPHLPISMDTILGEILGERIAREINALLAPVIRPGCSDHHIDFPGTITLSPFTLMQVIKDYCESLARHGFKNIVLIPTHGGNFAPVNTIAPEIAKELKGKANVIAIANLEEFLQVWVEAAKEFGINLNDIGHAGAGETSILLAEKEELVKKDKIRKGYTGKLNTSALFTKGLKAFSEIGILGDPTKASKEIGERIIEKTVEYFVEKIKKEIKDWGGNSK